MSSPSYNQFFSQMYASEMPNAQTVTGLIPRTCSLHWHSGMSPHKYYLTEKPTNVPNRCGCNKSFSLPYCQPPTNIIFKHIDKRIRGKIRDDQLIYNADFTPALKNQKKSPEKIPVILYIKSQVLQRFEQNYVNMIAVENSVNIVVE